MKIKNRVFSCAAVAAIAVGAQAGELRVDKYTSATLGREISFSVYLPNGYKDATASYPVIYLLHGADGDEYEWVRKGGAVEALDGLTKRSMMRPTVAVMPTFGPASWWTDGTSEKAETAMMNELIPYVESRYNVGTERSNRSIGGLSMGGYGSLNLALTYPDRFCAAAVISPAIYDPLPPQNSASRRTPQFIRDGKFDPDIWKSLNYPTRLETYKQGSARVPMWIVSGDHDYLGVALASAQLYWRLYQLQPKQVELRVIDGNHDWTTLREALPAALEYIDAQCVRND